jgi:hypothetical protein
MPNPFAALASGVTDLLFAAIATLPEVLDGARPI